jgi:hypothetical protein
MYIELIIVLTCDRHELLDPKYFQSDLAPVRISETSFESTNHSGLLGVKGKDIPITGRGGS